MTMNAIAIAIATPQLPFTAQASFYAPLNDLGAGAVNTALAKGAGSATFTRATTATTILSTGLIANVASGVARSYYSPAGVYLGYLSESASTNLVLQSENLGAAAWTPIGAILVGYPSGSGCGSLTFSLCNDNDGANLLGVSQNVTFTGNAVKAVSLFVQQGTSTSSVVRLRDTTASADRLLAAITWSGGVPTTTMTTGTLLGTDALGNNTFRIRMLTTSVTAANTNSLQLYPATDAALSVGNTGTILFGGIMSEDSATACSTYIPTTTATVTRNADDLQYPKTGNIVNATGTSYCEFSVAISGANARILGDSGGNSALALTSTGNSGSIFDATNLATSGTSGSAGAIHKFASVWSPSGLAAFIDGGNKGTNATYSGSIISANIAVGHGSAGANPLNGTVKSFRIWTFAGTDSQVAGL